MLSWLVLALQLQGGVLTPGAAPPLAAATDADSLRDRERARQAQAGFEQGRRYQLPWSLGGGGIPCDVRIGRFCWWADDGAAPPPAEPPEIARRREELLAELDALGRRRPGDGWIAGMRVYYRIDNRQPALADSAARECGGGGWWCTALRAWAAHARGAAVAADSGFTAALAAMPDSTRCAWRDVAVILPPPHRERYERLGCTARVEFEGRYWALATPRLHVRANEWRSEFLARRIVATLLASAVTPHRLGWGRDAEEVVLRYGWPVAWSRTPPAGIGAVEPGILGHDPSPSVDVGPRAELLDGPTGAAPDLLQPPERRAVSRYAHHVMRRVAPVRAQLARFRRGDSTLVVAAWRARDDSLRAPGVAIAARLPDGAVHAADGDSATTGSGRVMVPGAPTITAVELSDSVGATFGRARMLHSAPRDSGSVRLSDLLLYRAQEQQPPELEVVLAHAIAGDSVARETPLGLFWESYAADGAGAEREAAVLVERIDRGFFRATRQRLGLADPDSPVQVRWMEPGPAAAGVTPRALSLDLSLLPVGRYRITVSVTPATGPGATASREIDLR